jgi:glycine dehydrogenase subunit 1
MYDGQTSLAEACLAAIRINRNKKKSIAIFGNLNPDYKNVLDFYLEKVDGSSITNIKNEDELDKISENTACVIVQIPDYLGNIEKLDDIRKKCDEMKSLLIVVNTEILAFGMINPPSVADIVCGEAGSFGKAMSLGGPSLGYFACKKEFVRQMPGRLCGVSLDEDGKRSFVLTLNAREQHIRREKATSNICTNQSLFATSFTIHLTLLGEDGFKNLALLNHQKACDLSDGLEKLGIKTINKTFFNEFAISVDNADEFLLKMKKAGIFAGIKYDNKTVIVAATEKNTKEDIEDYLKALN